MNLVIYMVFEIYVGRKERKKSKKTKENNLASNVLKNLTSEVFNIIYYF